MNYIHIVAKSRQNERKENKDIEEVGLIIN